MKKPVFFGLFFSLSLFVAAQNVNPDNFQKMVDFLPPAPNAAAINKHEALSINKNNGSPSFNIPIFSVKGNKLSANISIGYSSTGIKVDELASRVGMGWALNAGGVITRTVRGVVDEWNTRIAPYIEPIQSNCGNYNFMKKVTQSMTCNASGCNGWDAEPDLFNFSMNGQSGSFVYDATGNPLLIPAEKYKIQKNLGGSNWDFIITDMAGIEYYFGGTGAVEKTKRLSNCGKNFDNYIANTWYLIKIKHPNGETINFTYLPHNYEYDNGVNETQYWAYWMIDPDCLCTPNCPTQTCPAAPPTTKCVNRSSTQGVLLHTITCNNDIVNFQYGSRLDCTDKLVSQIRHYNNTEHIETFNFFYNQQEANPIYQNETNYPYNKFTPYLTDLQKLSSDLSLANTHRFIYNDPAGRPPRLSFSQDHWGYFNGKVNPTSFIPKPRDRALVARFPNATADREPDPAFASKGMLTKIIYPTGGIDQIDYEPNISLNGPTYNETLHEYSCSVTGTGFSAPNSRTVTFTISTPQAIEMIITNHDNGGADTIHNKTHIEVVNSSNSLVYEEYFNPGGVYTRYLHPTSFLAAGNYTITYTAQGAANTTTLAFKYYAPYTPASNVKIIVGGMRVKRVFTGNPNEKPTIKRYHYANMDDLTQSSLYNVQWPIYKKDYRNAFNCTISSGGGPMPHTTYCHLTAMYSGSLVGLFNFGSGLISYGSVIESIGENFEGGAIESKFYVGQDAGGSVIWGEDILGAPLTNSSSIFNGKLHEEIIYKKPAGSGPLFPIKKTEYIYMIDQRQMNTLYGYNVNQEYNIYIPTPDPNCPPSTPVVSLLLNAFDIVKYSIYSWWTHPESVTETIYDENGQNPVTTINNSFFDNDQHFQLTRSETINSKNEVLKTTNTYPPDHSGTVYAVMTAKNIITPVVTSKLHNGTSEVMNNQINYSDAGNNNYVPVSVEKSVKGNALETEGTIDQYDANGNILQFTGKNGIVTAIIWGYNYKYPVAQVVGATYANAIAQLTIPGNVTAIQVMDGATLRTELHRIRTGITAASVTTYTYKIMTGVTSITDPNNKTNTYEYDSFNRLMNIKDQDGNVVKKNEYQYAGSDPNSILPVYFNDPLPKYYHCQSCESGYLDNTNYTYIVPAGKYYSLIDKPAANALAAADTDGQEYANKKGKCINYVNATCTGEGYKVVNCICELGDKVCESSTPDGNGGWISTFHYHWSDGSNSQSFSEYIPSCTGIDKKFLNCICETGSKECETVVNNGGGSYTLTYHYHFSDNTNSSTINETITCSGIDKKIINCTCKTAWKVFVTSEFCGMGSTLPGCCARMWRCGFYYKWSDGSKLYNGSNYELFYECTPESCMPMEEFD